MLRIIIADDHQVIREGIKRIINSQIDLEITAEVETGEALLSKISTDKFDVVILDVGLPGRSGIGILGDIRKFEPKLPVLIFSMQPEERVAIRAIRAGANAYLSKEAPVDVLLQAIRTISTGRKYITPSIAEKLAETIDDNFSGTLHSRLSDREFEVMCLIARGKSVKEIAESKSISINTVNTYRTRILSKMDFNNNMELAYYVIKNKLID
ncbi:MAG: response regulator transcription factor [Melioribacteraceae bacterium]|jgi:two-component system invasion response regulator UvrY|nr:response regulator transcription factor [Melioribacteraceae bacterium]